jgi:hypothetical protein
MKVILICVYISSVYPTASAPVKMDYRVMPSMEICKQKAAEKARSVHTKGRVRVFCERVKS